MERKSGITKVDIEHALKSKNPKLHKMLPGFVMRYIKRVTHEKEMNEFLAVHGHKYDFDFIEAVLDYFKINLKVKGLENIPEKGGVVIACNHPLGGLDALALMHAVSKKRTDIKFIVNDILLQITNLQGIFVGVNKHGRNSNNSLSTIDSLYASEHAVMIFPAGLVSRKQKGEVKDLEWKKSFISRSKKYERNIVPVHIKAKNSKKFYNLALWRKRFGIKANIEMFYLIDEMYKQHNQSITITIGEAIPSFVLDKSNTDQVWAEKLKEHVYALESGNKTKMIL